MLILNKLLKKIFTDEDNKYPNGVVGTLDPLKLKKGKFVSFGGDVALLGDGEIEIQDYAALAYGVTIHTTTHDYSFNPPWRVKVIRPVKIGKAVWVGTGAIILPGVVIGKFAVVGAGAVVTANVPDRAIVVGNPARILKFRENINPEHFQDEERIIVQKRCLGYLSKEVKLN